MKNVKIGKKLAALFFVTILSTVMVLPAAASSHITPLSDPDVTIITGIEPTGPVIQPNALPLYQETLNGQSTYTAEFACAASNGPDMRFTITNTGSNTIYVDAYYNGEYLSGYNISGGGTKYTTAHKTGGLTGTFKFVLTTDSTAGLYCTLYAIQGTNV